MNDDHPNSSEGDPGRDQEPNEFANDGLPLGLADALRQVRREQWTVNVPQAVDETILARARAHLEDAAPRRKSIVLLRRPWLAAAAGILFAACLAQQLWRSDDPVGSRRVAEDIDRSGRVDILDAFHLARRIESGTLTNAFDFNGDRRVDAADVDLLARRAVQLDNKS